MAAHNNRRDQELSRREDVLGGGAFESQPDAKMMPAPGTINKPALRSGTDAATW